MRSEITIRPDHKVIFDLVEPNSRVLDLGCGSGDLLYFLARDKQARVQGIEMDEAAIYECVRKGLSVFHSDIESSVREYPAASFDYIVLNQSMQEVKNVDSLIRDALRIGGRIIVGFPNFAYIGARTMLFFGGKAPITKSLPYRWYDTPNVRFLSITDFREFCAEKKLKVLAAHYLGKSGPVKVFPNLFAHNAVFMVTSEN